MEKSKKTALLLYGGLAILVVASLFFILRPAPVAGTVAAIQVGSQTILELPLENAKDGTFSIQDQTGLPIIFEVKDHAIRFADSNCPDKICVRSGYLYRDMDIASCLPNNTVLVVTEK